MVYVVFHYMENMEASNIKIDIVDDGAPTLKRENQCRTPNQECSMGKSLKSSARSSVDSRSVRTRSKVW